MRLAMEESKALRAALRKADRKHRAALSPSQRHAVDNAETVINRMPQARMLREAAASWGEVQGIEPVDQHDSAAREANRALLDAAVRFVRALRGEEP